MHNLSHSGNIKITLQKQCLFTACDSPGKAGADKNNDNNTNRYYLESRKYKIPRESEEKFTACIKSSVLRKFIEFNTNI